MKHMPRETRYITVMINHKTKGNFLTENSGQKVYFQKSQKLYVLGFFDMSPPENVANMPAAR